VEVIGNMCDVLWRSLLGGLQSVLKAAKQEQLVLALLKGYQSYIFSCNTLGKTSARDGFLIDLCKVAGGVDADAQQESVSEGGAPVSWLMHRGCCGGYARSHATLYCVVAAVLRLIPGL
jgi:hypothetical protein